MAESTPKGPNVMGRALLAMLFFGGLLYATLAYTCSAIERTGKCTDASYNAKQAALAHDGTTARRDRATAARFCEQKDLDEIDRAFWENDIPPQEPPSAPPSAASPVPASNPLPPTPEFTLDDARKLTPDERAASLKAVCYDSGICDEDKFETLSKAATSPSERAALKKIRFDHEQRARKRVNELAQQLEHLEGAGRTEPVYDEFGTQCMAIAAPRWKEVDAVRHELEGFALTIPGVGELRGAVGLVRNCVAACVARAERRCEEARTELRAARAALQEGASR